MIEKTFKVKVFKGLCVEIAKSIPSTRSRTGHLSTLYVSQVLNGKVKRENETTKEIWRKAKEVTAVLTNN